MPWAISADLDKFEEAVAWFLERVPITDKQFEALTGRARKQALRIAGAQQADVALHVLRELKRSLEKGEPFNEFKKRVAVSLTNDWGAPDSARIETIHRNAVQTAYNRGRIEQMSHPSVMRVRPFWMLDAILDHRTSEICNRLDGTVLEAEDPFWDTHTPPLHHRCRSSLRSLRTEEAERRGVGSPPDVDADDGFGTTDPWTPDKTKYPKGLKP